MQNSINIVGIVFIFRKWLYNIARGIDYEPVTTRLISKSIGCCKKFPGRSALTTSESTEHWVNELTSEIAERIEKDFKENNRRAKQISVHFSQTVNDKDVSNSRTLSLNSYDQSKISQICLAAIKKYCMKSDGTYNIKYLGFSVGNFEVNKKGGNISAFFKNMGNLKNTKYTDMKKLNSLEQDVLETPQLPNQIILKKKMFNENKTIPTEEQILDEDEINGRICYEDNDSIYSAETDELNEDSKSLIYYEDIYPDSVISEPIFIKPSSSNCLENKCASDTKISESFHHNSDSFAAQRSLSSSFFSKYFENYSTDDSCNSSPVERNFDTSKILAEESDSSDERKLHGSLQIIQGEVKEEYIKLEMEFKKEEAKEEKTILEICPECKKSISRTEFGSHMDYHYALNIVREEAHLYKPIQSSTSEESSAKGHSRRVTKKRAVDMKPIHTYLQRRDLNEENSELCSECNKRIKLDDIISHMDYHAAKTLHLEINAKSSIPNRNNIEKAYIKAKKKKNVKNTASIVSFLK